MPINTFDTVDCAEQSTYYSTFTVAMQRTTPNSSFSFVAVRFVQSVSHSVLLPLMCALMPHLSIILQKMSCSCQRKQSALLECRIVSCGTRYIVSGGNEARQINLQSGPTSPLEPSGAHNATKAAGANERNATQRQRREARVHTLFIAFALASPLALDTLQHIPHRQQ